MRRALLVAALGVAGLLWWGWPTPKAEAPAVRDRSVVVVPSSTPEPGELDAEQEAEPERPVQGYDRVVQACGFEVEERCVDAGCGAVVSMPDLDRYVGWARLLWSQPGVVGSTAARDLGLPVAWTPCGNALEGAPDVLAAQVSWNQELWCVGEPLACDRAAADRYGFTGFTEPGLLRRFFVP